MKKRITRISVLQSSKIATALYALMGFIYTLIGIPMLIFGGDKLKIMGIIEHQIWINGATLQMAQFLLEMEPPPFAKEAILESRQFPKDENEEPDLLEIFPIDLLERDGRGSHQPSLTRGSITV